MPRIQVRSLVLALTVVIGAHTQTTQLAAQQKPPPAPPAVLPNYLQTKPVVVCVDCDEPFDFQTHKTLLDDLLKNPYLTELRKALYFQDTFHQFESKAHFDNCDFQSSMDYLAALLDEVGSHVAAAEATKPSDKAAFEAAVRKAFFALGQALHGTQDFYAHTNYVELQAPKVKKVTEIHVVAPWRKEEQTRVLELQNQGLVSGVVFWGFPKKCPTNTISHGDLAKDSPTSKSGKKLVAHLDNLNHHRIAAFLAREASLRLMRDAFKRWPLLKEANGPNVLFDVLIDRRGL